MLTSLVSGLVTALSLLVVDLVVPGVDLATFPAALIAALSIAVVNTFIRPVISLLSLPLTFITFGLFSFVVNGICFWAASAFVPGFSVHGILGTILGPIVLTFVSTFLGSYFAERYPSIQDKAS
ncbi:MAG: phage holin family protein [Leptolyngbyaceae cyanobacterium]